MVEPAVAESPAPTTDISDAATSGTCETGGFTVIPFSAAYPLSNDLIVSCTDSLPMIADFMVSFRSSVEYAFFNASTLGPKPPDETFLRV